MMPDRAEFVILLADRRKLGAPMRGVNRRFPGLKTTERADLMKRFASEAEARLFLARSWSEKRAKWKPIVTTPPEPKGAARGNVVDARQLELPV